MTGPQTIVADGVVSEDEFAKAPLRVLWLLREFNDPAGTFTDLSGTLRKFGREKHISPAWRRTYGTVACVTYGLLHPDERWDDWADKEARYASTLSQIAAVNVKKIAGGSVAVWSQLATHFRKNEAELRAQIFDLRPRPQVVIGGNVLWLCKHWCGNWQPKPLNDSGAPYESTKAEGIIWVHANHPSKPMNRRRYFERIRDAIAAAQ